MANYHDASKDLFARWRASSPEFDDHFVEDGIIDLNSWEKSEVKVLFVLKETNDHRKSISELICKATTNRTSKLWKRPTFHNIGRWAYGLLQGNSSCTVHYKIAHENRTTALLSCAFINLKKTTGGRTATKSVNRAAARDASFLREQIAMINPDLVVCGGTYPLVKQYLFPEMKKVGYRIHGDGIRIFINAKHPAYIKKRVEMYADVVGSYHHYRAANQIEEDAASTVTHL